MKYKVIACSIFKPYINNLDIDLTNYDITYLKIHLHETPHLLATSIQEVIDRTINVDRIIILYGLCGGSLLDIHCHNIPLMLVRVHDCLGIFIGNKKYKEIMNDNLSWSCYSLKQENYINNSLSKWQELYDEETVKYLQSVFISDHKIYINMHIEQDKEYLDNCEVIDGNLNILKDILTLKSDYLLPLTNNQYIELSLDDQIITVNSHVNK